MKMAEKILCQTCGEYKNSDQFPIGGTGKPKKYCKSCDTVRAKERYHLAHPDSPYLKFRKDDFHCTKCGELKKPEEFKYDSRGRREGICLTCFSLYLSVWRHKNLVNIKNGVKKVIFHCKNCGIIVKWPKEPYLVNKRLCQDCYNVENKNKSHLKDSSMKYRDFPKRLHPVDYAEFKLHSFDYKVCPQCGEKKYMIDFSEEKLTVLRCVLGRFVITYREIYAECSHCRNRMHELFDRFIMNAY